MIPKTCRRHENRVYESFALVFRLSTLIAFPGASLGLGLGLWLGLRLRLHIRSKSFNLSLPVLKNTTLEVFDDTLWFALLTIVVLLRAYRNPYSRPNARARVRVSSWENYFWVRILLRKLAIFHFHTRRILHHTLLGIYYLVYLSADFHQIHSK